jgi:hypothetical protein
MRVSLKATVTRWVREEQYRHDEGHTSAGGGQPIRSAAQLSIRSRGHSAGEDCPAPRQGAPRAAMPTIVSLRRAAREKRNARSPRTIAEMVEHPQEDMPLALTRDYTGNGALGAERPCVAAIRCRVRRRCGTTLPATRQKAKRRG